MVGNRSVLNCFNLAILLGFSLVFLIRISLGATNPSDVAAINSLYAALGSPSIPGWVASGGDPCGELWQGVVCEAMSISSITLIGANLGGELGDSLGGFSSLTSIFLSDNKLTGSIPSSLSSLTQLSAMSLNNNELTGEIPDAFEALPALINLDLSSNNLSGQLPPSMRNLSSLTTLSNGNPFNSSIAPLPPPTPSETQPPAPPFFPAPNSERKPPTSGRRPARQADGPSTTGESNSGSSRSSRTRRIVWISIAAVLSFIILILAILLFMPRCLRKRRETYRTPKRHEIAPYTGARENHRESGSLVLPSHDVEKAPPVAVVRPMEENRQRPVGSIPKPRNEELNKRQMSEAPKRNPYDIDMSRPLTGHIPTTSVKVYSIASLQQYTNSFSQENLVGGGMLGNVYRAELPDGRDDQFIELVNSLDNIRHANVVELMGYCSEHGQRLLIYEYCTNGTLQDALHSDDEFKRQLSWNTRIRMALGAARALEYLHEVCEPPIIHRNFKSANVLLDDELAVLVSDCGLAPLILSGAVNQLSGQLLTTYGYGAPEFESGVYTTKSDVYSFGVVMLELLTGRMSYDRTRTRGEQFLVRWAVPQLHDIDAFIGMVDPAVAGNYPVKSLSHFADIISRCVLLSFGRTVRLLLIDLDILLLAEPEFRPPMSEVVQDLMQLIRRESPRRSDDD
ncbi:hypothetical protein DH2020_022896 [Rehmannia glutinosa]|uniref:Protein kinase domain-containing protein n=1 Tax=Rehmannia glutinosa TaxID=99300 RepID=A0ABR0W6X3_REHGL